MPTIRRCKLCQSEKPLLKKSHIIPEFMYESLFDANHKIDVFSPADRLKGKGIVQRPSTGEYESSILCSQCDNEIIGQYESYGRELLKGSKNQSFNTTRCQTFVTEEKVKYTRCTNINYVKFKLFLLSILWRASISSRPFFNEVNLGPYEEEIRKMLLNGDPKKESDFPILLWTWLDDKSFPSEMIGPPRIIKTGRGTCYTFTISGVIYLFHVSPGSIVQGLEQFTLRPNNEVYLLHLPKGKSEELFLRSFGVTK